MTTVRLKIEETKIIVECNLKRTEYKLLAQGWPLMEKSFLFGLNRRKGDYTNVVIYWWDDKLLRNLLLNSLYSGRNILCHLVC